MQPPWELRPDLESGSIGWRMGDGEHLYNRFYRMFSALSEADRVRYERDNPAPAGWKEIYDLIRKSPWL